MDANIVYVLAMLTVNPAGADYTLTVEPLSMHEEYVLCAAEMNRKVEEFGKTFKEDHLNAETLEVRNVTHICAPAVYDHATGTFPSSVHMDDETIQGRTPREWFEVTE
jgi:hypothetical protein